MIRVLIVEDQRMAREDMENYIQSSGRYCLAASITNAAMAETVCRQSRCKLVLMDVCTENDESGLVAAEKIKKTMPQIKIIIVTSLVECSFIDRARKAGVESFWYKDAGKEELLKVMDRTMKGESVYPDAPPVVMIGTAKSCDFTPGELAVLRLVVEGCLLYTSDAADEEDSGDLGGSRIIKKKKEKREEMGRRAKRTQIPDKPKQKER